jgi:hypothetical protein
LLQTPDFGLRPFDVSVSAAGQIAPDNPASGRFRTASVPDSRLAVRQCAHTGNDAAASGKQPAAGTSVRTIASARPCACGTFPFLT